MVRCCVIAAGSQNISSRSINRLSTLPAEWEAWSPLDGFASEIIECEWASGKERKRSLILHNHAGSLHQIRRRRWWRAAITGAGGRSRLKFMLSRLLPFVGRTDGGRSACSHKCIARVLRAEYLSPKRAKKASRRHNICGAFHVRNGPRDEHHCRRDALWLLNASRLFDVCFQAIAYSVKSTRHRTQHNVIDKLLYVQRFDSQSG